MADEEKVEKPTEETHEDEKDSVNIGWVVVLTISVILVFVLFKVMVMPAMQRNKNGATSIIKQSNEEGYWRERLNVVED